MRPYHAPQLLAIDFLTLAAPCATPAVLNPRLQPLHTPVRVLADNPPPEGDGSRVSGQLRQLPFPREAVKDGEGGMLAETTAPQLPENEELTHAVLHTWRQMGTRCLVDQGEAHSPAIGQNEQRMIGVIGKPGGQMIRLPQATVVEVGIPERG